MVQRNIEQSQVWDKVLKMQISVHLNEFLSKISNGFYSNWKKTVTYFL